MTSLEHVSVKHALDRLPSWTGDTNGHGGVDVAEEEGAGAVSVGVAVTTADDVDGQAIGIVLEPDVPRAKHDKGPKEHQQDGREDDKEGLAERVGGVGTHAHGSGFGSGGSSWAVSARGGSRSRSRLDSESRSPSGSLSRSHSPSSMRPLGMGESSVATSWTQADAEGVVGEKPSVDTDCGSSADRVALGQEGDEARSTKDGFKTMSSSHLRNITDGDISRKEEVLVIQEEDVGEVWHPLRYNGKARSQDDAEGESVKVEVEEDVGSTHALESVHGTARSSEMDENERSRAFGSTGRNTRSLRLEFKSPSPQPWDEIDPPTENNEMYASDYYSTLNSKKFETLQKSRRRPLIPHSAYYFGPPAPGSAYGTPPVGQIGVHHPREIVRIERDYAGGELCQFSPIFPLELEGRVTPTQFHQTINDINEILISAHSIRHAFLYNFLAVVTLQLSTLVMTSHYTKEMRRLKRKIDEHNRQLYNLVGLNILWPRKVAFLFLEIEYY